ncbi:MAG: hypothetical protein R2849_18580 [Thermomicrobiales bacterium]
MDDIANLAIRSMNHHVAVLVTGDVAGAVERLFLYAEDLRGLLGLLGLDGPATIVGQDVLILAGGLFIRPDLDVSVSRPLLSLSSGNPDCTWLLVLIEEFVRDIDRLFAHVGSHVLECRWIVDSGPWHADCLSFIRSTAMPPVHLYFPMVAEN